jgi:hypothetical protein
MSRRARFPGTSRRALWSVRVVAAFLVSVSAAACVAAGVSPSTDPVRPPAGGSATAIEARPPIVSPAISASPVPSLPLPEATPAQRPVPSASTAPAVAWTGIQWTAGSIAAPKYDGISISMAGWSRGYAAIRTTNMAATDSSPEASAIIPSESADGLHWTDGKPLDISDFDFYEWVGDIVEGPAGLLAVGYRTGIACGGPDAVNGIWMSKDGISWRRTSMAGFGGGTVHQIDAGSSGYIATGHGTGSNPAAYVWTSHDGLNWAGTNVDAAAYKGLQLTNATAFAGGFVMAGANPDPKPEGCGSGTVTPSLWWSPDGKTWTRDIVAGTTSGSSASFSVSRISDHMLVAHESSTKAGSNSSTEAAWTSTDGRTWKQDEDRVMIDNTVVTYGPRGLVMSTRIDQKPLDIWDIRADLTLGKLTQTGDIPTEALADGGSVAFGPRGVVVARWDGTQFWIGVPAAG